MKNGLPADLPVRIIWNALQNISQNTLCIHVSLSPPFWWASRVASRAFLLESPRDTSRIVDSAWSRSLLSKVLVPDPWSRVTRVLHQVTNLICVTAEISDLFKSHSISNILVSFVDTTQSIEKSHTRNIQSIGQTLFRVNRQKIRVATSWRCGSLSSTSCHLIKDLTQKFPPFSKSASNLARFDTKFVGVCSKS